ncbi:MAG: PAS domain S-box protein [Bacteroidota bacterium]|nr:PAS domain S-box protein [Bacteroidota bacterium]
MIQVAESLGDMVYRYRLPGGEMEYVSRSAWERYRPGEEPPVNARDFRRRFIHDDSPGDPAGVIEEHERERKSGCVDYLASLAGGDVRWVEDRFAVLQDDCGDFAVVVGAISDIHARKTAEEEPRNRERMLRMEYEQSADGFVRLDLSHRMVDTNPAFRRLVGYEAEELAGMTPENITHPDDWQREREIVCAMVRSGTPFCTLQKRYVRRDGATVWAELTVTAVRDESGAPAGFMAIVRDITEKHRAEEEIRSWRTLYELVTAASGQVVYDLDIPSGSIRWGGSIEAVLGYGGTEPMCDFACWAEAIHPSDRDRALAGFERCRRTLQPYEEEFRFRRADGGYAWILTRGFFLPGESGTAERMVGMMIDIERSVNAENAQRENERKYRTLFEVSPSGILVENAAGTIVDVNAAFCRSCGYRREELVGKPIEFLVPEEHLTALRLHRADVLKGKTVAHDIECRRKDGGKCWLAFHEIALPGPDGEAGILVVADDITARREQERKMAEAKENAERSEKLKDVFIANVSHEIRTPLNVLVGFVDLIGEIYRDMIAPEHAELFRTIDRSGKRLLRTIEHLLNISSIQAGTFQARYETLDLAEAIAQVAADMRPFAHAKGLSLETSYAGRKIYGVLDRYAFEQALINLVDNAIKFTPAGYVRISLTVEDEWARIDIVDSGIGISDEYAPYIWEKFSQESGGTARPFEGLGLGMALTKHYVELNRGMISLSSTKGGGTTVTMFFPLDEYAGDHFEAGPKPSHGVSSEASRKRRVLVVEDDPQSQQYMKILLGKDYLVDIAPTAGAVLEILGKTPVDIILMDISLHGEIDGLQLTRIIRQKPGCERIPIIAVTAHAFPSDRQRSLEAGCTEYISKPFQRDQLMRLIAGLTGE